jgi:hypothetical protein
MPSSCLEKHRKNIDVAREVCERSRSSSSGRDGARMNPPRFPLSALFTSGQGSPNPDKVSDQTESLCSYSPWNEAPRLVRFGSKRAL